MKAKNIALWLLTIGLLSITAAGLTTVLILKNETPGRLIACMEAEKPWLAWGCKKMLQHLALTDAQVAELNRSAGAGLPTYMRDTEAAEETLKLFISRGVDINAGNSSLNDWTALHGAALGGEINGVRLLLRHGANPTLPDREGRTASDLAKMALEKDPNNEGIKKVIEALDAQMPHTPANPG